MRRVVLTWCLGLCWLCAASGAFATFVPLSTLVHAENGANVWIEQPLRPDAGDVNAPQQIQGTNITEIDGIIGTDLVPFVQTADFVCIADVAFCCPPVQFGDCADAFRFFFGGGAIQFTGFEQFDGGTPLGGAGPDITLLVGLPLQLFTDGGGSIIPPDTLGLGCAPGFPCYQIGFNNLAAGNYILRATENLLDPPYTISITTGIGTPQASVPEPEQLSLLAAALAALFVARRRKARFIR